MPSKSDISEIIARLQKLEQDMGDFEEAEEAASRAKADLESVNRDLAQAKAQMHEAQAGLTQVQKDAQKRFDQDMYNKQGSIRDLNERIKALEEKAKALNDEVSTKGGQLRAINDSLDDARRKLAG
jgi:chromosome segregation ATPase